MVDKKQNLQAVVRKNIASQEQLQKRLSRKQRKLKELLSNSSLERDERYQMLCGESKKICHELHQCRVRQARKRQRIRSLQSKLENTLQQLNEESKTERGLEDRLNRTERQQKLIVEQVTKTIPPHNNMDEIFANNQNEEAA